MKPQFSFKYNDKLIKSSELCGKATADGVIFEIEKDVTVTLKQNDSPKYNANEWVLYFENKSDKNSGVFSEIMDSDLVLPIDTSVNSRQGYIPDERTACVKTMTGTVDASKYYYNGHDRESAEEYTLHNEYLDKNPTRTFGNVTGRSSDGTMPFFDVTADGHGFIMAIGWTGSWKAYFERKESGVAVKSGLKETKFYLEPAEKLRTSSVLFMEYNKGEDRYNKFRKLIKNHFSHKSFSGADRDGLMANELWGGLHAEFPHLLIDNCSSGGRRIDIETLKRAIAFFRSDYQCNFNEHSGTLQTHNAGISRYLPYNGCTSKTKSDTYAARSSFSASWGAAFYNAVFQSMTDEDLKWAKSITDEYRRIRKYMSCNFHNHGAEVFDESSWAIWQYHDDRADSGIVMAFRRSESPFDNVTVSLKELESDKKYCFTNLNDFTEFETSNKLKIELPEKKSSVVFEYKAK